MAGIRWPPDDSELSQARVPSTSDLISDDDRSIAADSWSIKSDYGSTLDDEQRHVDAADALSTATFRAASDYSSDKEEPDAEVEPSVLGLQSYWDATYADELANFHEHGHSGEVWFGAKLMEIVASWTKNLCDDILQGLELRSWTLLHLGPKAYVMTFGKVITFGAEVMDIVASWTKNLCDDIAQGRLQGLADGAKSESVEQGGKILSSWNVLDIGTGNGLLLHELAKQGFCELTGSDYSEGAINLARSLADHDGFSNINFLVDDVLETKLEKQFQLVMDKGTLDAIGLHPDGTLKRIMYWDSVSKLVAPGGILVITSCNNTKDELVHEVDNFNQRKLVSQDPEAPKDQQALFRYLSHVQSYPTFTFGGSEGSRVATVAFLRS